MEQSRREFLRGSAWMGLAAVAAGCQADKIDFGGGAPMAGFAAPALRRVRIGFVGVGARGNYALKRLSLFPGVEIAAFCDINPVMMKICRDHLSKKGLPPAREFLGPEAYRDLCQCDGMDFIMDLRWVYCLQNGLPLDMDVYDLASWSCLCELTEISQAKRGAPVDIPDFTRGAWRTMKPLGIVNVDVSKMKFSDVDAGPQQTIGQSLEG